MDSSDLRERGIYLLPDGREVIASGSGGFFRLYDPMAWKYLGPPLFEIRDGVCLTCMGRPTPWRVSDLIDQNQTAPNRHAGFEKSA